MFGPCYEIFQNSNHLNDGKYYFEANVTTLIKTFGNMTHPSLVDMMLSSEVKTFFVNIV